MVFFLVDFLKLFLFIAGGGVLASDDTKPRFFVPSMPHKMCDSIEELLPTLGMEAFVPRQYHQFTLGSTSLQHTCAWCQQHVLEGNVLMCRQVMIDSIVDL